MKTKHWLLLLLIIGIGLLFRLVSFGTNPISLYWDEVAIGLDARSLNQTGRDINGNTWLQPLFKSYGDYKAPVYILLTTLFGLVFGVTEKIVRLPSLFAYIGLSFSLFFLVKEIFPLKKLLPWISLITLSFLPWSYHFSRIGMESHLSLFFLTSSIYTLIKGLKDKKLTFIILSSLLLSLGIYSYIVLRIIGPLIYGITFLLYRSKSSPFNLKSFFIGLVIIGSSIITLTSSNFYQDSQSYRLSNNNLLTSTTHISTSVDSRLMTGDNLISRGVYHRYYYQVQEYFNNYFEYFSPKFLLFNGDPNLRHHTGYGGELLLVQGIFLVAGLLALTRLKNKPIILLSSWLIISPSVAALVNETPHASRAIYLIIPLTIIIALGVNQAIQLTKTKQNLLLLGILFTMFLNFSLFFYDYQNYYPNRSSLAWIQPYSAVFKHFSKITPNQKIFITPEFYQPELYARFYLGNYDNFTFNLPNNCPPNSLCITTDNWQTITKESTQD